VHRALPFPLSTRRLLPCDAPAGPEEARHRPMSSMPEDHLVWTSNRGAQRRVIDRGYIVSTRRVPESDIALEESFAPIVPIIKAADEQDALRLANMSQYGLSSAVCGGDLDRAVRFAQRIDAGMTHVNDMTVADEQNVPFGGEKNSGLGRFNGHWILEEMTRLHWVSVPA